MSKRYKTLHYFSLIKRHTALKSFF